MGVIFGQSGCGKSSLVKAGLLPRLADSVVPVYLEATGDDTEARLLKELRKHVPHLPANLTLLDSVKALQERPSASKPQQPTVVQTTPKPIQIFYAYSHNAEDESLRDQLEKHLSLLKRQGIIAGWHDRQIGAGEEWKGQIDRNLESAQVVLLLISPSFLASDYCYDIEMKRAIERHDHGEAKVVPIILRPVDWGGAPFDKLQVLPSDGKPVTLWQDRDEAFKNVAVSIRRMAVSEAPIPSGKVLLDPDKRKVLIVLDQFEQWLHAKRAKEDTELAQALRQCDGRRVQSVVMVRDDFFTALRGFMGELGIALRQWENFTAVDLFDLRHARKVLTAFGQAFGALPDDLEKMTDRQREFLDQAISGHSRDGRIISVRLALFAEMIKRKDWTPETLREVGGTEGVGVIFLEETFGSTALKSHQKAAQAVLKALIPESGTDIKGHMRSHEELLGASGYAARPRAFGDLLHILDSETRLITPIDPEGIDTEGEERHDPEGRFYQLTHDYLVPSLRGWLTRKQRETRKGRAELRLAERSALWNAKPENRLLPSFWEWVTIGLLTMKKDWTEPQRKMMRRAGRVRGRDGLVALLLLVGAALTGLMIQHQISVDKQATTAVGLVQRLLDADTAQVPEIVRSISAYRRWADPELKKTVEEAADTSRKKLHASLALLPVDANQVDFLFSRLLAASPTELPVPVIRDALKPHQARLIPKLWCKLDSAKPGDVSLLRAASALADYDGTSSRWEAVGGKVAEALVTVNPVYLGPWLDALLPVRVKLTTPLVTIFRDKNRPEIERTLAASILKDYASDNPDLLADLLLDSEEKPFDVLFDKLKARQERAVPVLEAELARKPAPDATADAQDHLAQRQARAAVALVSLGQGEKVWTLLRYSPDPSVRSYIVNWLKPLGAGPQALMTKLEGIAHDPVSIPKDGKSRMDEILFDPVTSERRALILALGGYDPDELSPDKREPLMEHLREMYRNDPDAGIHGAAEWTLRRWKQGETLKKVDAELQRLKDRGNRRWYVNSEGQTLAVIEGPIEFSMGSPVSEPDRDSWETPHRQPINRRFAIATKEVTKEQYQRFLNENPKIEGPDIDKFSPEPTGPRNGIAWYEAAAYCNWLSQQEGLATCYEPNDKGEFAEGMKILHFPRKHRTCGDWARRRERRLFGADR